MKKVIALAFVLFTSALMAPAAQAHPVPMSCKLNFKMKGGGFQIVVGHFKLSGTGRLDCVNIYGETESHRVKVTFGGHPVAARVGIGHFHVRGIAGSIGLDHGLEDLFGRYLLAGGQVAIGHGVGASFAVQNPLSGLNMSVSLSGITGFGGEVGLSSFKIQHLCD